jgi:hypothetical protein
VNDRSLNSDYFCSSICCASGGGRGRDGEEARPAVSIQFLIHDHVEYKYNWTVFQVPPIFAISAVSTMTSITVLFTGANRRLSLGLLQKSLAQPRLRGHR